MKPTSPFAASGPICTVLQIGTGKALSSCCQNAAIPLLETDGRETSRGIRLNYGTSAPSGASYNDRLILTGVYNLDQLVEHIIFV